MRSKKTWTILLAAVLLLSFVLPAKAQDTESVRVEANDFIRNYYNYQTSPEFFPQKVLIQGKTYPFRVEFNYDVTDIVDLKFTTIESKLPAVFYEIDDRGKMKNGVYQFLGQTKLEETITDVRYPLESNWGKDTYLEDLKWIPDPWSSPAVRAWWKSYSGASLRKSEFDYLVREDPELAAKIDHQIAISNILQLREENGEILPVSDIWSDRTTIKCWQIPWHEYVHILIPPTDKTWGFGIGFVDHGYRIGYKSFPIAPFGLEVEIPDFSVRSDKDVYTGAPGSKVTVIAAVKNEGFTESSTDFGARWETGWWDKPIFYKDNITVAPGGDPHFNISITVPDKEAKVVLRANTDRRHPPEEQNFDNNTKVITIRPASVDLKVTITPVRNPVTIAWNSSYGKITANIQVTRKDSGEPVQARLTISGPGGTKTLDFTSTPGQAYKNYYTFDRAAPGTYTITAEAWPVNMQDANPADNKASCQIQVTKKPAPTNDVPKEPDIHGELGGM